MEVCRELLIAINKVGVFRHLQYPEIAISPLNRDRSPPRSRSKSGVSADVQSAYLTAAIHAHRARGRLGQGGAEGGGDPAPRGGVSIGRAAAQIAAERLGLSVARVYWLIRTFRAHPVTSSLLPHAPGQAIGARRLARRSRAGRGCDRRDLSEARAADDEASVPAGAAGMRVSRARATVDEGAPGARHGAEPARAHESPRRSRGRWQPVPPGR